MSKLRRRRRHIRLVRWSNGLSWAPTWYPPGRGPAGRNGALTRAAARRWADAGGDRGLWAPR